MQAMVLEKLVNMSHDSEPLQLMDMPDPKPGALEILLKISVCGVCHTELDEIEGRTPPARLPIIPGHQVVGRVQLVGENVHHITIGDRVGVAWIYSACGICHYCRSGCENLCPEFKATGRDAHGGYAQYMTVPAGFAYLLPPGLSDAQAAPLLCAGAVGYRALRLTALVDGQNLGLTGFGASGHLVLKMARHQYPKTKVFVFARSVEERKFACELGAVWAGDCTHTSPEPLDSIIDTTPVWTPVVEALKNLAPGGRLVINAIGKENSDKDYLLRLDYPMHLWREKEIKSVANVTRRDVREFLALAAEMNIKPEIQEFTLAEANQALIELKQRKIRGAKVLRVI